MRLIWPARSLIRSFYDPTSHRLTLVSNVVDDTAEGRVYGKRLAITFSTSGEFRDLELLPGSVNTAVREGTQVASVPTDEYVAVWVPETEEPVIEASPLSAAVTVRLSPAVPERWILLRGSGVQLGLVDDDVLVAIQVEPVVDPRGESEAEWLDSLGA